MLSYQAPREMKSPDGCIVYHAFSIRWKCGTAASQGPVKLYHSQSLGRSKQSLQNQCLLDEKDHVLHPVRSVRNMLQLVTGNNVRVMFKLLAEHDMA